MVIEITTFYAECQDCDFHVDVADYQEMSAEGQAGFEGPYGYVWQVAEWHDADAGQESFYAQMKTVGRIIGHHVLIQPGNTPVKLVRDMFAPEGPGEPRSTVEGRADFLLNFLLESRDSQAAQEKLHAAFQDAWEKLDAAFRDVCHLDVLREDQAHSGRA